MPLIQHTKIKWLNYFVSQVWKSNELIIWLNQIIIDLFDLGVYYPGDRTSGSMLHSCHSTWSCPHWTGNAPRILIYCDVFSRTTAKEVLPLLWLQQQGSRKALVETIHVFPKQKEEYNFTFLMGFAVDN